jgi:hypothetical protein
MPKYCMHCGKQNEDKTAFCVTCGEPLSEVEQGRPASSPVESAVAQLSSVTYTAETGPGAQKYTSSDISLKDDKGAVVYVAKRTSPLHQNYEIDDPQGQAKGSVNHKAHITHVSFEICDQYKNVLNVIKAGPHRKGSPPTCWLEDAGGNRQGTFEFIALGAFGLVKSDGTKVFEARLTAGGRMFQMMKELSSRRYAINVFDPSFSALKLAGTVAAIETLWV